MTKSNDELMKCILLNQMWTFNALISIMKKFNLHDLDDVVIGGIGKCLVDSQEIYEKTGGGEIKFSVN